MFIWYKASVYFLGKMAIRFHSLCLFLVKNFYLFLYKLCLPKKKWCAFKNCHMRWNTPEYFWTANELKEISFYHNGVFHIERVYGQVGSLLEFMERCHHTTQLFSWLLGINDKLTRKVELKSSVFYCLLLKVNYDNLLLVSDNKIPPGLTHRKMAEPLARTRTDWPLNNE